MSVKHIALITTSISALLISAVPAYAVQDVKPLTKQTEPSLPEKSKMVTSFDLFGLTDKNADGILTMEEQVGQAGEYFDKLDINKDANLTLEELQVRANEVLDGHKKPNEAPDQHKKAVDHRAERHFAAIDTNHDGQVTRDEYLNRAIIRHKMADADSNGEVTRTEYDDVRKRGDERRREMFRKNKTEDGALPGNVPVTQPPVAAPKE